MKRHRCLYPLVWNSPNNIDEYRQTIAGTMQFNALQIFTKMKNVQNIVKRQVMKAF